MPLIIPANSAAASGGFAVDNSLRFNRASSDYLNRTPSSEGNKRTMTFSFWLKRTQITAESYFIYSAGADASNRDAIMFANQSLRVISQRNESTYWLRNTTRLFRDSSAWSHIVIAIDTTQGTDSNRIKIYINGVQETAFETYAWGSAYPSQNFDTYFNDDISQAIGSYSQSSGNHHDGYISEFVMIDGTALDPTSFGEFDEDSGIWKPISVSGLTFGTNGFYLETKQSGTSQNSSGLGADTSGNDNHFAVNNLTAIDQSTDTCTNNSATWNSLVHFSTSATFSEGNLKVAPTENTSRVYTVSTIAMPTVSGSKWYAEFKYLETNDVAIIGILDAAQISYVFSNNSDLDNQNGDTSVGRVTYRSGNGLIKFPSGQSVDSSVTLSNNDIVMIALDSGSGKIWFGVNGTWTNSGDPAADSNGVDFSGQSWWTSGVEDFVFFAGSGNTGGHDDWEANFGSPPFAISSGNSDGNGYGNFEYAVPSGYYALNTKNLAEYG